MDPQQLIDIVMQRKWVALAALVIGLVVRLLKSDTKIPIDIPPKYRVWLALALGGAAGALDKLAGQSNVTWTTALVQGLVAALLAILGHNVVIDSMRGGKEFTIPGLIKPNTPPGPGKPPSIPPIAGAMLFVIAISISSCALFTRENAPKTILTFEQIACIAANAFVDDATLAAVCQLVTGEQKAEGAKLAGVHRVAMTKQFTSAAPRACVDAGADATPTRVGVEAGAP
jgi:small basic protein